MESGGGGSKRDYEEQKPQMGTSSLVIRSLKKLRRQSKIFIGSRQLDGGVIVKLERG